MRLWFVPMACHEGTMKAQLQALQLEAPECVLIARRIQRLGFSSPEKLRTHFESFGEVKSVHVSHSLVKSRRDSNTFWRQRPAALGFVVMSAASAAARILAEGPEHTVEDVKVTVQAFRRNSDVAEEGGDDADQASQPGQSTSSADTGAAVAHTGHSQGERSSEGQDSPVCPFCGSTIAVQLGMAVCQVCRRGVVDHGSWGHGGWGHGGWGAPPPPLPPHHGPCFAGYQLPAKRPRMESDQVQYWV